MYIYQTAAIDFFFGMQRLTDVLTSEDAEHYPIEEIVKFALECAKRVATAEGSYWEGDIRGNALYLFGLPDPEACGTRLGIVWKQDNNGTTFICSPIELPWLSENQLPCKG